MNPFRPTRRWIAGAAASAGAMALSACDRLANSAHVKKTIYSAEGLTRRVQRLILTPGQLAPEFGPQDISPVFRPNGSTSIDDPAYKAMLANAFKDWRLVVDGLVDNPLSLSIDDLRARPGRTQITRHDCVEGWSCIGQWTGALLGPILTEARLKPAAKFIVFYCADLIDPAAGAHYYESIGLADAFHPQTLLAYAMNGQPLAEPHGAPIRLRVERQLGYKQAKYIMRIAAVDSLKPINGGKGGYWEDSTGYEWYGGI